MISPPLFVWAIAAVNDRHGDATVHGLTSFPLTETAERLFNPNAAGAMAISNKVLLNIRSPI
jgi:hypothetical protein